ncbi:ETC complex I subunit [Limobrevibacterium gyesilva]|uniref:ETC complex I subunit n=1 Tax=Limobrevibacterium gyesilva TaxID=2991712 RepID=A0AA41YQZ0_9PROT|nr:ETC complex I subunit [Limobrevibacterium gyesilva]MCW3475013.1 ETC complex I subunit [Limobrevibacterium gyesilva]
MAPRVRIYQQPKTAMQSGMAGTHEWVLEFEPTEARRADPLMGWIGSSDTRGQVRLTFATRDEAVAYAAKQGFAYEVELPHQRRMKPKAYADNFKFGRSENWTH